MAQLTVRNVPDEDGLNECRALGALVAERLRTFVSSESAVEGAVTA